MCATQDSQLVRQGLTSKITMTDYTDVQAILLMCLYIYLYASMYICVDMYMCINIVSCMSICAYIVCIALHKLNHHFFIITIKYYYYTTIIIIIIICYKHASKLLQVCFARLCD